jgi:hypothetical protein
MVVNANENDLKGQVGEHSRLPKRVVGPADATDFAFEEWTIDVPTAWLFSCPPYPVLHFPLILDSLVTILVVFIPHLP